MVQLVVCQKTAEVPHNCSVEEHYQNWIRNFVHILAVLAAAVGIVVGEHMHLMVVHTGLTRE